MRQRLTTKGRAGDEIQKVAEEGYIYGYPLVLLDVMRRMQTAVPFPSAEGAPPNQFFHSRFLPEPHAKAASRPHADSLSTTAWLDLSRQPVILSIPRTERYYLLSLFSAWGDLFAAISPRTHGTDGVRVALTGPLWRGSLPDDVRLLVAPTETVWINGRIQAADADDLQIVHGIQDSFRLTPLGEWARPASRHTSLIRSNVDRRTTPEEHVENLTASTFYTRLSILMRKYRPEVCDIPIVRRLAQIGFFPSEDFVFEALSPDTIHAMQAAVPAAKHMIARAADAPAMTINNWAFHTHPRHSEPNYLTRAAAARNAFWSSLAEDVVAFRAAEDRVGEPLRGANEYVIHFDQKDVPAVNAFWSITAYDSKQKLPANALHRYVIGDHNRLRLNSDNSISIYIQHAWPGTAKDSNWLPAPKDTFELVLQLYWPKSEVLNGTWRPPAVMRVR